MARAKTKSVRERILEAAVALLKEHGVKKLAQPQVARRAGIPQGHLTYYFPKKQDLLLAVARRSIELVVTDLEDFFASQGWKNAGPELRDKTLSLLAFVVKDRPRTRILIGLLIEAESDPKLRKVLADYSIQVRRLIAAGISEPEDSPDVDIVQAALWGLSLQHLLFEGHRPDEYTDTLIARLPAWIETRRDSRAKESK